VRLLELDDFAVSGGEPIFGEARAMQYDRVQFLRNARPGQIQGAAVANNDLGTVRAMTEQAGRTIEVEVDALEQQSAKTVRFDPKAYNRLEHGYVVTSHKSQGQQFKRAG
jgi:ATP-dependent exoDNAse (exonuclease V) alpha subunit